MIILRAMLAMVLIVPGPVLGGPSHSRPVTTGRQTSVLATAKIRTSPLAIQKCGLTGKTVKLSFDDGGSARQVNKILSVLKQKNVRALFFPTGVWAKNNPKLVKRIQEQGHIVGNHTFSHPDLTTLSTRSVKSQIKRGVRGTTKPKLLRPPYGAGLYSSRIQLAAKALGYQLCGWTVDTRDWSSKTSAKDIIRRVTKGQSGITPRVHAGGMVLMHMHGRYTGASLARVIDGIHAMGLKLPRRVA